jgi:putative ABC transport system permease protein
VKFLPLILRNLGRNKLRSLLTGGAIALAIALVCFLRTMPDGLDRMLDSLTRGTRISVHHKSGLVYPLPQSYLGKVRSLAGVVAATSWTWFGGAVDLDRGVEFPNFAVDPDSIGIVYEDEGIPPEQIADFQRYRDGAIVSRQNLEKFGWKLGDRITLTSDDWPLPPLDFRIVGEIPDRNNPSFWFRRDYFEQAMLAGGLPADQIGMIWVRVDRPERVEPLMREIDAMFRNSEAEVEAETEKSFISNFFGSLKDLVTLILLVTGLVALCIVFIAANTASMSVRERVRELAVLRAIGYGRALIFGTLLAEATLLSGVAGTLGALASLAVTLLVRRQATIWQADLGPLTQFVVTNAIVVEAVFLAFFIGILSGYLPAWGASRRSVSATLREVF